MPTLAQLRQQADEYYQMKARELAGLRKKGNPRNAWADRGGAPLHPLDIQQYIIATGGNPYERAYEQLLANRRSGGTAQSTGVSWSEAGPGGAPLFLDPGMWTGGMPRLGGRGYGGYPAPPAEEERQPAPPQLGSRRQKLADEREKKRQAREWRRGRQAARRSEYTQTRKYVSDPQRWAYEMITGWRQPTFTASTTDQDFEF